jgi:hypothetical protein
MPAFRVNLFKVMTSSSMPILSDATATGLTPVYQVHFDDTLIENMVDSRLSEHGIPPG